MLLRYSAVFHVSPSEPPSTSMLWQRMVDEHPGPMHSFLLDGHTSGLMVQDGLSLLSGRQAQKRPTTSTVGKPPAFTLCLWLCLDPPPCAGHCVGGELPPYQPTLLSLLDEDGGCCTRET